MKMEAQGYSETSVLVYPSTLLHISKECNDDDDDDDFSLLQHGLFLHTAPRINC
jgi:hypothetical protein